MIPLCATIVPQHPKTCENVLGCGNFGLSINYLLPRLWTSWNSRDGVCGKNESDSCQVVELHILFFALFFLLCPLWSRFLVSFLCYFLKIEENANVWTHWWSKRFLQMVFLWDGEQRGAEHLKSVQGFISVPFVMIMKVWSETRRSVL